MISFDLYDQALPYDEFLNRFGTATDKPRWDRTRTAVQLTPDQIQLLNRFTRKTHLLVLAGAWCGDCASQCPIFERFAEISPALQLRYLDRDSFPEVQQQLQINGGHRVPVVVFFSEDGHEVARYGERTLAAYRQLVSQLGGEVCGSGVVSGNLLAAVTEDWLREFERVQWILRLSPRLRRLHGD